MSPPSHSQLLALPHELRLQIYQQLFSPASQLTLRSLFIRAHFLNTFMTTQPAKHQLSPALLRVCRQIHAEAAPILYGLPHWLCACRIDALAAQIGEANFSLIRWMSVDVDDLGGVVEALEGPTGGGRGRGRGTGRFAGLEVLEVEGFQSMCLSSVGAHRARVEALRLVGLAESVLRSQACQLGYLVQGGYGGGGGSGGGDGGGADARDVTMGRVKWRFVRDLTGINMDSRMRGRGTEQEGDFFIVNLSLLREVLLVMLKEDEIVRERGRMGGAIVMPGTSLPVMWTSAPQARFSLYPFLRAV